jgi:hypothetical protein
MSAVVWLSAISSSAVGFDYPAATERLKIIGAFHAAYWHPAMISKPLAKADNALYRRSGISAGAEW